MTPRIDGGGVGLNTQAERPDFRYLPPPKHAPEPDLAFPFNECAEVAAVAAIMGLQLMPWQRFVLERATAYRLDAFGRRIYRFSTILITVPRQSGKTTLMTPVRLHRIMTRPGIDAFSTAQTGKDAGKRIKKMIEEVMGSPLAALFKESLSNGSEGLLCLGNRSRLTRFSPVIGAMHGETPYLVDFDEVWKYPEALGDALIGGATPGGITLDGQQQVWMISTKGTAASTFMNKWVAHGVNGTEPGLAYFEWSCPEGLDPDEPATWWTFHPALGNTITEDQLRTEMYREGMTRPERIRAYMNLLTEAEDPIIDPDAWDKMHDETMAPPPDGRLALSYEVAPGNTLSAVLATWRDEQGRPRTRVVHQAPGTAWLVAYVHERWTEWKCTVAADGGGPVRRITDKLIALDVPVVTPTMTERGEADGEWLAAARDDKTLGHDGSAALATSVAAAVLRTTNGVERVSRDKSAGPVAALIASSVGLWAYDHPPEDHGVQLWG